MIVVNLSVYFKMDFLTLVHASDSSASGPTEAMSCIFINNSSESPYSSTGGHCDGRRCHSRRRRRRSRRSCSQKCTWFVTVSMWKDFVQNGHSIKPYMMTMMKMVLQLVTAAALRWTT